MNAVISKIKIRNLFVASCMGIGALFPLNASAETLADALVAAYNHSGLLDQNRAVLRAADEDVAIAKSALKPVLRWTGDLTQTFNNSVSGKASWYALRNIWKRGSSRVCDP